MRISDWSSDVCSSDLGVADRSANRDAQDLRQRPAQSHGAGRPARHRRAVGGGERARRDRPEPGARLPDVREGRRLLRLALQLLGPARGQAGDALRSEEHTSELQSLMRISYAVFCLKKKKKHENRITT